MAHRVAPEAESDQRAAQPSWAVNCGDFILRLSEDITDAQAEATLHDYIVTPQLAANFKDALNFIRGAVQAHSGKEPAPRRVRAGYLK